MPGIQYQELVITCEACDTVEKYRVSEYDECLSLFREYQCPNGCGKNLYSFFTVGLIEIKKAN